MLESAFDKQVQVNEVAFMAQLRIIKSLLLRKITRERRIKRDMLKRK